MISRRCMVFSILIWLLKPTIAWPRSGVELGGRPAHRTRRDVPCREDLEYRHDNICCLKCPAGTYLKSHCSRPGERGTCEECEDGTYTEHANLLHNCFKCTKCRTDLDQEIVSPCTHVHNTECQCKVGRFCVHDEPCEVCKKCLSCEKNEVTVRNCTAVSNTECKKPHLPADDASGNILVIVLPLLVLVVGVVVAVVFLVRRRRRQMQDTDPQRNISPGLKDGQEYRDSWLSEHKGNGENRKLSYLQLIQCRQVVRAKSQAGLEDECKELCNSLTSSASNSQNSLTGLPCLLQPTFSPTGQRQPKQRVDDQFPKLVPVNGEESLRKCFEYFEELDIDFHKRFFRSLSINDNVIKSKEHLHHEDRIHELLNIWLEKVGREANLNDLLNTLLELNQRLTAENVRDNAISNGHYVHEKE